jgi:L-asparaginase/Glu-tRNA(Gln) amidotransferase subunit D
MSTPDEDLIVPRKENMNLLLRSIPDRIGDQVDFHADTSDPFIDSANASVDDIMKIVEDVRKRLANEEVKKLIVLYGSDSMSYLMAGLGNGISQKELGDKSVIVTCSMNHLKSPNTDAVTNFNRAVSLALYSDTRRLQKERRDVRGKVGLLFDQRFFPPFGIEKPQISKTFAFASRFQRMAKFNGKTKKWEFDRNPEEKFDQVRGNPEERFVLAKNVHPYEVTPMTDYAQIAGQISKNKATILIGMGDGNLRSDPESIFHLKTAATNARGPIVVVGSAIYNAEEGIDFPTRKKIEMYQGNGGLISELISGGAMTVSEAMTVVSNAIAKAEAKGITDKAEIEESVRFAIMNYPFRDLRSSKVTKK